MCVDTVSQELAVAQSNKNNNNNNNRDYWVYYRLQ